MAGLLELFARYVNEIGSDPIADAADHARSDLSRDPDEREAAATDIERIGGVLGLVTDRMGSEPVRIKWWEVD